VKKAFVVAFIIGAGFLTYRFTTSHGPVAIYKSFAEKILHRDFAGAAAMSDGLTADDLEKQGSQEHIGAGPEMFQKLFPSQYQVETNERNADGSVTLHVLQTVFFNPQGVESAVRPAMYAKLRQVITLHKGEGGWRVTAFTNTCEKMDTVSGK